MKELKSLMAEVIRESVDASVKKEASKVKGRHIGPPDDATERLQKAGITGEATLRWDGNAGWVLSVDFSPRDIDGVDFHGARNATISGPPHGLVFKLSR
jgi:hypothetical protein